MKRSILSIIILLLIFLPVDTGFAETKKMEELERMSNDALQLAKTGRINDVQRVIKHMTSYLEAIEADSLSVPTDELRIIRLSHNEVIKLIESESFTQEELVMELTKFRLVLDAAVTDFEPLWTHMEEPVMQAFHSIKMAAEYGDKHQFENELQNFLNIYDMLYPSLVLDVPYDKVQKVDAQIQFFRKNPRDLVESETGFKHLELLETDIQSLFEESEEDEADPSLWWVIISTGGIILSTLTYVGYRKYRGEKEKEKQEYFHDDQNY